MKKYLLGAIFCASSLFGAPYSLHLNGQESYENIKLSIELEQDDEKKLRSGQKYDIRSQNTITSLKIITAPGLKGTLVDEREIIAYYKTSLNVSGLKIRNLYKVGVARVYGDEQNVSIEFDKDHYQNITSFLRYHNISKESIKDIDNLYGTWQELDLSSIQTP